MKWGLLLLVVVILPIVNAIPTISYEPDQAHTHIHIDSGLKTDYYYEGDCLNTVSNIGWDEGDWWEYIKYGISWGTTPTQLLNNYVEGNPSGCNRVDTGDDNNITLQAWKTLSISGKTLIFGKQAYIQEGQDFINETFMIQAVNALPVDVWFVLHRTSIKIGGDNENDYMVGTLSNGTTIMFDLTGNENNTNLIVLTQDDILGESVIFKDPTQDDGDFIAFRHFMPEGGEWKMIIVGKEVYFAFRAGRFNAGQRKTLETKWVDAGGGGLGACTPGWTILSITGSVESSSVNTETGFWHKATVSMTVGNPGGSCTIQFRHKPASTYIAYTTAYYTSYQTNSLAKMYTGDTNNPLQITVGGTYTKNIKCGGRQGTLYLEAYADATHYSRNTVTCTDVVKPNIDLQSPINNYVANASSPSGITVDFTCNASDNTKLAYIDHYANFSGSWALISSQAYGNLVYSASKTFQKTFTTQGNNTYKWSCRARDTRSPTNDNFASENRTIKVNIPINYPPIMNTSRISPSSPTDADTLLGYCNATDANEDILSVEYKYFLNGVLNSSGSYANVVEGVETNVANKSSSFLVAGQNWTFECKPSDPYSTGSALNSSTVTILLSNTPPIIQSSRIAPASPADNDTLLGYCNATDAESGIYYNYEWYLNTILNDSGTSSIKTSGTESLITNRTSDQLVAGQNWTLQCQAEDTGTLTSAYLNSTTATIIASNTPPIINLLSASPSRLEKNNLISITMNCTDDTGINYTNLTITSQTTTQTHNFILEVGLFQANISVEFLGNNTVEAYCYDTQGLYDYQNTTFFVDEKTQGHIFSVTEPTFKDVRILSVQNLFLLFIIILLITIYMFSLPSKNKGKQESRKPLIKKE